MLNDGVLCHPMWIVCADCRTMSLCLRLGFTEENMRHHENSWDEKCSTNFRFSAIFQRCYVPFCFDVLCFRLQRRICSRVICMFMQVSCAWFSKGVRSENTETKNREEKKWIVHTTHLLWFWFQMALVQSTCKPCIVNDLKLATQNILKIFKSIDKASKL